MADSKGMLISYIGTQLLTRVPFSHAQLAEILSDEGQVFSLRQVRSWVSGQTLALRPTLAVTGHNRKQFGFLDLVSFVMGKRLVGSLPTPGVNTFLNEWRNEKFLSKPLEEKLGGYFVLTVDPTDTEELDVDFFGKAKEEEFWAALVSTAGKARKCAGLDMQTVFMEALRRLACWLDGMPFPRNGVTRESHDAWVKAFEVAGNVRKQIDELELTK